MTVTRSDWVMRAVAVLLVAISGAGVTCGWVFAGVPTTGPDVISCVLLHIVLAITASLAVYVWRAAGRTS